MNRQIIERLERRAVSFEEYFCLEAFGGVAPATMYYPLPKISARYKADIEEERNTALDDAVRIVRKALGSEGAAIIEQIQDLKTQPR